MMKSIRFWLLATAILIFIPAADAQPAGKIFRIGFLHDSTASGSANLLESFLEELHKLGWIKGKNFTIESRFAEQKTARLIELAAELVRLKVDLIVVSSPGQIMAAKALLMENSTPTREQIAEWLTGNICRCGAYGAIAQSILEAAQESQAKREKS